VKTGATNARNPSCLSLLSESEAETLSHLGRPLTYQRGHVLFRHDQDSTYIGVVIAGRFRVSHTQPQLRNVVPDFLEMGDTVGEYTFALDGQIAGGKREATVVAEVDESCVFAIDYKKFATYIDDLPRPRNESLRAEIALLLIPHLYPEMKRQHFRRTRSSVSDISSSLVSTPGRSGNRSRVSPVTILNLDSVAECSWIGKRKHQEASVAANALLANDVQVPQVAFFNNGEISSWYFGNFNSLMRRSRERMASWQLLEELTKKSTTSDRRDGAIALLVCCKNGKDPCTESVQCRFLDKKRLEMILSGAKSNQFTGYIVKFQRENHSSHREYILQCLWSQHSFSVEWVKESDLECFTQVHIPSHFNRSSSKRLQSKMRIKYHKFIPGSLSLFGDHLITANKFKTSATDTSSQKQEPPPLEEEDVVVDSEIIDLKTRELLKSACQKIAATVMENANESSTARAKAELDANQYGRNQVSDFISLETMTCFFKISKMGKPVLLHCSAAMSHPETTTAIPESAKNELMDPKFETFRYFAALGSDQVRLSGMGERAFLLDFTEFLALLTQIGLLYRYTSVTDASSSFKQVCMTSSVEDGQLDYAKYCACMRILSSKLRLDKDEAQEVARDDRSERNVARMSSEVSNISSIKEESSFKEEGQELQVGLQQVKKSQKVHRKRMGRILASAIIAANETEEFEKRVADREEKYQMRIAEYRKKIQQKAAADRKAVEQKLERAQHKAEEKHRMAEMKANETWERVHEKSRKVLEARMNEARKRQQESEMRRAASRRKLLQLRQMAERRRDEISKKSELLESHREEVFHRQKIAKEKKRELFFMVEKEKDIMTDLFQEFPKNRHPSRPWRLIDLSGDALPDVFEIAKNSTKDVVQTDNFLFSPA